jgi:hypothetical protein
MKGLETHALTWVAVTGLSQVDHQQMNIAQEFAEGEVLASQKGGVRVEHRVQQGLVPVRA